MIVVITSSGPGEDGNGLLRSEATVLLEVLFFRFPAPFHLKKLKFFFLDTEPELEPDLAV